MQRWRRTAASPRAVRAVLHQRSLQTACSAPPLDTLLAYGERVLKTGDPATKVRLTLECQAKWDDAIRSGNDMPLWQGPVWSSNPPPQPARSDKPVLYMPKEMPSTKDLDTTIPIAILHALAHIELGAIDNYWDTIVRFDPVKHNLPRAFYHDFLTVASDEARHFQMVEDRLQELGSCYGDLPAHKALLEHATNTASDLAARIAVVPLVQEARGLDSGARLVHKLLSMGDKPSAEIVKQIVIEERNHVSCGIKWFCQLCTHLGVQPVPYFHELVLKYFPDGLPGPFDMEARLAANMEAEWYQPLETKRRQYDESPQTRKAAPSKGTEASQSARLAAFAATKKKVILAGSVWPERTSSAAGVRSSDLIGILQNHGYQVLCVSPSRVNAHTDVLRDEHNVECIQADANSDDFQNVLLATDPQIVIFDRFIAEEMYGWQAKKYAPTALRVLDLQDVHFLRKAREFQVKKRGVTDLAQVLDLDIDVEAVEKHVIRELAAIHRSDLTLFVSDVERDLLVDRFQVQGDALHRCDFFYPTSASIPTMGFADRKHIAFIGSFKHAPNVDGIEWLKKAIMPHVRRHITAPDAEVHIYGSYGETARFQKMDDLAMGFRMMGFASDVHDTLRQYRLTVAPLRFGAGIKGKIADSWFVGTPCVSTEVGSEGMTDTGGVDSWGGLVANDPTAFASAMHSLYTDPQQWGTAQARGLEILRGRYDHSTNEVSLMHALDDAMRKKDQRRHGNWMGRILWSEKYRATEYMSRYIRAKNNID